jgi:hypothetical protein
VATEAISPLLLASQRHCEGPQRPKQSQIYKVQLQVYTI